MQIYSLAQSLLDLSHEQLPAIIHLRHGNSLKLAATGTHFGFVYQGHPTLSAQLGSYQLHPGMYFCLPASGYLEADNSSGIIITALNYCGVFSLGGPIETVGRFAYIDGGTTSLLIPPLMLGDPCLHALYFSRDRTQTMHTHPSYRIGMIVDGSGEAETPEGIFALQPGTVFVMPANSPHKFRTTQDNLTLVIFHPDSDTGFTQRHHLMLNQTFVEGVSASQLPQIQTSLG